VTRDIVQHNVKVALSAAALLAAAAWTVSQSNLLPVMPEKFVALWGVVARSLPVLGVYWAGAMGFGVVAQRLLWKETRACGVEAAGLGLGAMLLLGWLGAWAGVLNQVTAWGIPVIGAVVWVVALVREWKSAKPPLGRELGAERQAAWSWAVLLWVPGAALLLVAACCPPGSIWRTEAFGYDVMSYHLQVPREWLAAGRMVELEHNVYAYLSGLLEAGFLHVSWMHGSVRGAIYSSQLLHASTALLAAAGAAGVVRRFGGAVAPVAAGGVLLVVPWVMVVGSQAYNEVACVAFAAVALCIAYDVKVTAGGGAAVGLLCGVATLCKLTAGPMLAVPIGLVLLLRRQFKGALLAAVVGFVTLCPYLARNAIWTGNPVFPLATSLFGAGHWNEELVDRWQRGHQLPQDERGDHVEALRRQWLLNTGYGAVGGRPTPREMKNIARFNTEGGVPVLWLAVAVCGAIALWRSPHRAVVGHMALMLVLQVGFWLFASHLQSRFLMATILPAAVIVGLGLVELERVLAGKRPWAVPFAAATLVAVLGIVSFKTMLEQTQTVIDELTGRRVNLPPMMLIDALDVFGRHAINVLPEEGVKVYIVADNSRLLYVDRPIVYHSAFDANPLGEMIRAAGDDAPAVNAALRGMGVTHVWVHWQELERLHATYGYDRDVTMNSLDRLIATGWREVEVEGLGGVASLFELPPVSPEN